jgi:iron complex transport system substrate-binding protein
VFAAGAPAEVLLYTLVPEKLVGRNHLPSAEAQEFMPAQFRQPREIQRLPDANSPEHDGELLALHPDVYIDYGDLHPDYIKSVASIQARTGIPGIILDGRLTHAAGVYRRLGKALGVASRGELLAREVERILSRYRGRLHRNGPAMRVYLAAAPDGSIPALSETLSGEIGDLLGAENVAGNERTALKRPITPQDLAAWNPDVIVLGSNSAARTLRALPELQAVPAVRDKRVAVPPAQPYGWGARPPSINRLLGLVWLAHVAGASATDEFETDVRRIFATFFQVELSDEQLRKLQSG